MVGDLLDFIHHERDLYELHVAELRVPFQMGVCNDESCACFSVLERTDDGDVIPNKDTVEHIVGLLEIRTLHGDLVELDEVLFNKLVSKTIQTMLSGKTQ